MTTPIRKVSRPTISSALTQTSNIWRTTAPMRKRLGWHAGLEEDDDDLAHEGAEIDELPAEAEQVAAELLHQCVSQSTCRGLGGTHMLSFTTLNSSAWAFAVSTSVSGPPPASCRISSAPAVSSRSTFVASTVFALARPPLRRAAGLVELRPQPVQAEHGPGAADLQHGRAAALDIAEVGSGSAIAAISRRRRCCCQSPRWHDPAPEGFQ